MKPFDCSKQAPSPITSGQALLDELLGEIAVCITVAGTVEDNRSLQVAKTHGSGFLSGAAAAFLDSAACSCGADREADLMSASLHCILCVIAERERDAEFAEFDSAGYPSAPPAAAAKEPQGDDFFELLLARLAAGPKQAS